jgi:hypothetical protein
LDGWQSYVFGELVERLSPVEDLPESLFPGYEEDAARWVLDVVMPHHPGKELLPYQADVLDAIAQYRRVMVKKGNGRGLTTVLGWSAVWFLGTRVLSRVVSTAGTGRQVKRQLFGEIPTWCKRVPTIRSQMEFQSDMLLVKGFRKEWFAIGFKAQDRADAIESGKSEGWHSQSGVYNILDECKAIQRPVWSETEGSMTDPGSKFVGASVPGHASGMMYDICVKHRATWKIFSLPSAKKCSRECEGCAHKETCTPAVQDSAGRRWLSCTPLVTQESVDEKAEFYGVDSPMAQNRLGGEFTSVVTNGLFELAWLEAAQRRWVKNRGKEPEGPSDGALDVGRGGDPSALSHRIGHRLMAKPEQTREPNTSAFPRVEDTGIGCAISDPMEDEDMDFDKFDPGGAPIEIPIDPKTGKPGRSPYLNRRAEGWMNLHRLAKNGTLELPPDCPTLIEDLMAHRYEWDSNTGKIKIWDKETKIKPILGRSPNEGDSCMIAFAPRLDPDDWESGDC